ncbi:hypothetical protein Plhal703r1_c31g0120671 [Plasmopara halstedii]
MGYPPISSYEWLSEGIDGPIPPDQNVILWDKLIKPPQSVASFVALTEQLSHKELCKVIEEFLGTFTQISDPDTLLSTVQAQPSLHRALLVSSTEGNFHNLRNKTFGHAVLRELSTRTYPSTDDGKMFDRVSTLYLNQSDYDFQTVLEQLCPEQSQRLKLRHAEADQAMIKLCKVLHLLSIWTHLD